MRLILVLILVVYLSIYFFSREVSAEKQNKENHVNILKQHHRRTPLNQSNVIAKSHQRIYESNKLLYNNTNKRIHPIHRQQQKIHMQKRKRVKQRHPTHKKHKLNPNKIKDSDFPELQEGSFPKVNLSDIPFISPTTEGTDTTHKKKKPISTDPPEISSVISSTVNSFIKKITKIIKDSIQTQIKQWEKQVIELIKQSFENLGSLDGGGSDEGSLPTTENIQEITTNTFKTTSTTAGSELNTDFPEYSIDNTTDEDIDLGDGDDDDNDDDYDDDNDDTTDENTTENKLSTAAITTTNPIAIADSTTVTTSTEAVTEKETKPPSKRRHGKLP